ncbi:unnamed protein product [Durusdinium trenchii]|uniref:Uncharacterized protein n=1 Tax=Durusdinium trenchii TaxID=1381693 RepID=A0ABP0JW69_9DINO
MRVPRGQWSQPVAWLPNLSLGPGHVALGKDPENATFVGQEELLQADMALRVRALSRGLAKWRGYASRSHLVRRSVASFHRRRARAISRALNCWWLFCEARRQKEWLRIAKCKLAQKVRCFKRWHRYVASTRWRRPERRAEDVRCWHLSGAQQVLQAWRSYAQRSARDRHALRRSLEAQVAEASACLQGWHEVALGERDLRRQKEVAACLRLRQLRRRQAVHWLCARQDLGRRLGSHERKSQVRVFQIWRAQTRRARPFRRRLAWLVEALVRRQMLRAWCHVAGLGRRRRLVRCFCGDRLAERALRRAFEGWRRTRDFWLGCYASISYEEELSSAQLVARVLRAWWHAAVGRPAACAEAARGVVLEAQRHWIRRWHHCVVQRDQLAEILCKHMTRCAALALLGWSLYAADQLLLRKRAEELQRRRLVRAARGGLRRWAQRGARPGLAALLELRVAMVPRVGLVSRVFDAWTGAMHHAAANQAAHLAVHVALLGQLTRRAWTAWCLGRRKLEALRRSAAEVRRRRAQRLLPPWRRLAAAVRHGWARSRASHRAAVSLALQDGDAASRMVTFYRQHLLAAMLSCWQQDAVRGSEKKRHAGPQMATWKRAVAEFAVFGRRRRFFQLWREARRCRALDAGVWQRAGRSRRGAPWRLWMAWRCFARGRRRTAEQGRQVQSLRGGTWLLQRHLARWRMAAAGRWQCQRRRERRTRLLLHAWRRWVTSARQLEGMLSHRVVLQEGRLLQRTLQRWQWEVRSRVVARGIQAKRRHLWKISLLSAWREECQRLQLLRVVWTCWLRHRQQERHGRALRVLGPFMAAWRGHGHAREGLRRRAAEHLLQWPGCRWALRIRADHQGCTLAVRMPLRGSCQDQRAAARFGLCPLGPAHSACRRAAGSALAPGGAAKCRRAEALLEMLASCVESSPGRAASGQGCLAGLRPWMAHPDRAWPALQAIGARCGGLAVSPTGFAGVCSPGPCVATDALYFVGPEPT